MKRKHKGILGSIFVYGNSFESMGRVTASRRSAKSRGKPKIFHENAARILYAEEFVQLEILGIRKYFAPRVRVSIWQNINFILITENETIK